MSISLPLEQMTIEEKLRVMEAIWENLCQHADELEPPAWHGKVLEALEESIERGEETFENWETVRRRIRDSLS